MYLNNENINLVFINILKGNILQSLFKKPQNTLI